MIHLGDRDIVLERHHLLLLPRRLDRWCGQAGVKVPYTAIADAALTPPGRFSPGTWSLRLVDGTLLAVAFRRSGARDIMSLHHEVLVRALTAELSRL